MNFILHRRSVLVMAMLTANCVCQDRPVFMKIEERSLQAIERRVPMYPPIARAAHLSGSVVLVYDVLEDGKVGDVRVVSGNGMFVQDAIEAVKQWVYQPFLVDGNPTAVTTQVAVDFKMKEVDPIQDLHRRFALSLEECGNRYAENNYVASERSCREANDLASGIPEIQNDDGTYIHTILGNDYFMLSRFLDARMEYRYVLQLNANNMDTDHVGLFILYTHLAGIALRFHQSKEAERLYKVAIGLYESAYKNNPANLNEYRQDFKQTLYEYAWLKHLRYDNNGYHQLEKMANAL